MKCKYNIIRVPGAAQREAKRNGATQTRDPGFFRVTSNRGPGSAVHRSAHSASKTRVNALKASRCTCLRKAEAASLRQRQAASGTRLIQRRSFLALPGGAAIRV